MAMAAPTGSARRSTADQSHAEAAPALARPPMQASMMKTIAATDAGTTLCARIDAPATRKEMPPSTAMRIATTLATMAPMIETRVSRSIQLSGGRPLIAVPATRGPSATAGAP
jgi:hypothetical protein